jgi:hypothetical protein
VLRVLSSSEHAAAEEFHKYLFVYRVRPNTGLKSTVTEITRNCMNIARESKCDMFATA